MNKILKYGILITVVLAVLMVVAYTVFIHTFTIFGDPEKVIINAKCNTNSTAQVTTYTLSGNAVTERSIIVSVRSECEGKSRKLDDYIVFAAEYRMGSVLTKWLTDDTLEIFYSDHIEPINLKDEFHLANEESEITVVYRDEIKSSDLTGKWYSFNKDEGYNEFNIDASEIHIFSHYMGNRPTIKYKIEKNTLIYPEHGFEAEIHLPTDSLVVLKGEHRTDTLYRVNESIVMFNEIDYQNDSIFLDFYYEYENRAFKSWVEHGYVTEKELEESIVDTAKYEEEILLLVDRKSEQ